MKPSRCIPTDLAFGAIFKGDPDWYRDEIDRQCNHAVGVVITNYGFDLFLGQMTIPIPYALIDHLAETGMITCYAGLDDSYELTPVFNLPIPPELVNKAKGVYKSLHDFRSAARLEFDSCQKRMLPL